MIPATAVVSAVPARAALPRRSGRRPARRRPQHSQAARQVRTPLVLVVDDVADQRDLYGQYLRFSGYRVAEAANGFDALAKVRAIRPDLVVMDLSMPLMDGFEATRALKADPDVRDIPIIALTAHSLHLPKEWALGAGCDAYLTKPCLPADLAAAIRGILKRR